MPEDKVLHGLDPVFSVSVARVLEDCLEAGVEMRPYCGLRSPWEQAKLWRQSRTREQIDRKVRSLREQGAPFLADCLESVGPQHGRHVTNALPGYSWHQWGEAVDCFWVVEGAARWSSSWLDANGQNGYQVYTDCALDRLLKPGGTWKGILDWVHVQRPAHHSPRNIHAPREIDEAVARRWANLATRWGS